MPRTRLSWVSVCGCVCGCVGGVGVGECVWGGGLCVVL